MSAGWSAVVYGRTLAVDEWWRALPAEVSANGPVGQAVLAAVAGGERLESGPRFVLSRGRHGVLVGGACDIALVDHEMSHDEHGRPLYGFIGWHTADPWAQPLPRLADLERGFVAWAGATYREWVTPTWQARTPRTAAMLRSSPGPAPWNPEGTLEHAIGDIASDTDEDQWAALAADPDHSVLVTGWTREQERQHRQFTAPAPPQAPPPPSPPPPQERQVRQAPDESGQGHRLPGVVRSAWHWLERIVCGSEEDGQPPPERPPAPIQQSMRRNAAYTPTPTPAVPAAPPPPAASRHPAPPPSGDVADTGFERYFSNFDDRKPPCEDPPTGASR